MTDKEQFDTVKALRKKRRSQLKALKIMKANMNTSILMAGKDEDLVAERLAKLKAMEEKELKIRGNKFSSEVYSLEIVNRKTLW